MFAWFHNPVREARRLQRDARVIIDDAIRSYREQRLVEIACQIRDDLRHVNTNCRQHAGSLKRELERHTGLHRESRRRHDQVALTAHTLIIIHIRATQLGEPGLGVISLIQGFVEDTCTKPPQEAGLAG